MPTVPQGHLFHPFEASSEKGSSPSQPSPRPLQAWRSSCRTALSFLSDCLLQVPLSKECPLKVATDMFSMFRQWGGADILDFFESKEADVIAVPLGTHSTCHSNL